MGDDTDSPTTSRRAVLKATGGAAALPFVGTAAASGERSRRFARCPEATVRPDMEHCEGASMKGCADDHPATKELRAAVASTLEERYATVGSLIDEGFVPYFDTIVSGDSNGWSHWLSPEFIGDEAVLDPARPESVLVDNERWRPIGVMFLATRDGEPVDPPPAVYGKDPDEDRCSPWHYHVGLPGRFAWWYYRQVYEEDYRTGSVLLPCRTPCMMHVWTVPHPKGTYAHGGPPPEYRDGPVAEEAGFDTSAEPGEDRLDWDVLPDEVVPETRPSEYAASRSFDG